MDGSLETVLLTVYSYLDFGGWFRASNGWFWCVTLKRFNVCVSMYDDLLRRLCGSKVGTCKNTSFGFVRMSHPRGAKGRLYGDSQWRLERGVRKVDADVNTVLLAGYWSISVIFWMRRVSETISKDFHYGDSCERPEKKKPTFPISYQFPYFV